MIRAFVLSTSLLFTAFAYLKYQIDMKDREIDLLKHRLEGSECEIKALREALNEHRRLVMEKNR